MLLAKCLIAQDHPRQALEPAERAVELDPASAEALSICADAYFMLACRLPGGAADRHDLLFRAAEAFCAAHDMDPTLAEAQQYLELQRTWCYQVLRKHSQGWAHMNKRARQAAIDHWIATLQALMTTDALLRAEEELLVALEDPALAEPQLHSALPHLWCYHVLRSCTPGWAEMSAQARHTAICVWIGSLQPLSASLARERRRKREEEMRQAVRLRQRLSDEHSVQEWTVLDSEPVVKPLLAPCCLVSGPLATGCLVHGPLAGPRSANYSTIELEEERPPRSQAPRSRARPGVNASEAQAADHWAAQAGSSSSSRVLGVPLTRTAMLIIGGLGVCISRVAEVPDPSPTGYLLSPAQVTIVAMLAAFVLAVVAQMGDAIGFTWLWSMCMLLLPMVRLASVCTMSHVSLVAFTNPNPVLVCTARLIFFVTGVVHSTAEMAPVQRLLLSLWLLCTLTLGVTTVIAWRGASDYFEELHLRLTMILLPFTAGFLSCQPSALPTLKRWATWCRGGSPAKDSAGAAFGPDPVPAA